MSRLDELRGPVPPIDHNARTIAALAANPGCERRAVTDAAGIDKGAVVRGLGHPARFGLSPFALVRIEQFRSIVNQDGGAHLLRLLSEVLGLPSADAECLTVEGDDRAERHRRTADLLRRTALDASAATLLDRPVLKLAMTGHDVYLEPDVIAFQARGRFHVVAVKAFAVIDGQADTAKLSAASREAAVYVHAMRSLFTALGLDAGQIAHDVVLVCPKDFTNFPTATLVDVRQQLAILERQLRRLTRLDDVLATLPPGLTLDPGIVDGVPTRPREELAQAVSTISARYAPECLRACELAAFCRAEAHDRGSLAALGRDVRDGLGGIEATADVIGLADGSLLPTEEQSEVAARLRYIHTIYDEALA
ncbi:hypothetical protein [Spongiactinospora sp. TRM90649]|uniref:hypothetical protein n=1 Tax=Spongiactinospora sp. TRM90649 TaxID=3031114 RepID=UPI0023F631D5|nr:hypothetical protein [Spongiactinospora sp. TRM90649]MDF5759174.1 hypothetical protein [Spongiactinospora sp. TRM90649]